jgi:hypothetical protein
MQVEYATDIVFRKQIGKKVALTGMKGRELVIIPNLNYCHGIIFCQKMVEFNREVPKKKEVINDVHIIDKKWNGGHTGRKQPGDP